MPPPLVGALCVAGAWALTPAPAPAAWRLPAALAHAAAGLALELPAAWGFVRARTTVNPLRPERTAVLVTTGLHAWSRNPMYVGQALLVAAWSAWRAHPIAWLAPVAYVAWVTRFQVRVEERVLAARFGAAYEAYRQRVRRWL